MSAPAAITARATPAPRRTGWAAACLLAVLRAYKRCISPLFVPHCRFHPSCSSYAMAAVAEFGAVRGSWLAARRLGRCHPFHSGGYDPVPERMT